jgi:hypothetical protein
VCVCFLSLTPIGVGSIVFVTNSAANGNIGSADNADARCQAEADDSGATSSVQKLRLTHTWKAWLGNSSPAQLHFNATIETKNKTTNRCCLCATMIAVSGRSNVVSDLKMTGTDSCFELPTGTRVADTFGSWLSSSHSTRITQNAAGTSPSGGVCLFPVFCNDQPVFCYCCVLMMMLIKNFVSTRSAPRQTSWYFTGLSASGNCFIVAFCALYMNFNLNDDSHHYFSTRTNIRRNTDLQYGRHSFNGVFSTHTKCHIYCCWCCLFIVFAVYVGVVQRRWNVRRFRHRQLDGPRHSRLRLEPPRNN